MAKLRTLFRCVECGSSSPKWVGRCPACGEWNSLAEEVEDVRPERAELSLVPADRPLPVAEVDTTEHAARPTGLSEVDRVLGGGLVPGSATVLGGEPGIGKSTLVLQILAALAGAGARCLLVTAEESKPQVRMRAERLGALQPGLWLQAETSLSGVVAAVDEVKPDVLVIDSIQTVHDAALGSAPGSVTQVRECAHRLVRTAKASGMAVVLIGHVTKEGALAGPRVLEHVVDTVLSFEGERHHALRLLRAVKHRFGPTGELGLFEMGEGGLIAVPDPSGLFLGDRRSDAPGSVVVAAMEGSRPLLVEVQALVNGDDIPTPRRSAQGVDHGRLALLLAVLERRVHIKFRSADVYASAVGGVRIMEPAADLALALALASARTGVAVPHDIVACGEIGLGGEVRQVAHTVRRLAEAARLGFSRAVVPASAPEPPAGLSCVRVGDISDAVKGLGLIPRV